MTPQYSLLPLRRTHSPRPGPSGGSESYREQRPCLRLDFDFRCVYCLSSEGEAGPGYEFGGFEVDHFRPKHSAAFPRLKNEYRNLLWSCQACNRAKGKTWPTPVLEAAGLRFVDPSTEGLGKHIELCGPDEVSALTPAGDYTIQQLKLNSVVHRHRRSRRNKARERIEVLQAWIEDFEAILQARTNLGFDVSEESAELEKLRIDLQDARREQENSRPFDAPATCSACEPPICCGTPRYHLTPAIVI